MNAQPLSFRNWVVGTSALLVVAFSAWAQAPCSDKSSVCLNADVGRSLLGQGIAMYESGNFAQAEPALQAAVFSGLPEPTERASANKYIAFIYCIQKEWTRCEGAFEAAFSAYPAFALQAYELVGTPWREAYGRTNDRWAQYRKSGLRPHPSINRTKVDLTPSLEGARLPSVATQSARTKALRADHNLRLKISPWAQVRVNGKSVGVTPPLNQLKLPMGTHTIELRNPGFEAFRQVIELTDEQLVTLSHDFDAR